MISGLQPSRNISWLLPGHFNSYFDFLITSSAEPSQKRYKILYVRNYFTYTYFDDRKKFSVARKRALFCSVKVVNALLSQPKGSKVGKMASRVLLFRLVPKYGFAFNEKIEKLYERGGGGMNTRRYEIVWYNYVFDWTLSGLCWKNLERNS